MVSIDELIGVRTMADSALDATRTEIEEDSIGGVLGRSVVGAAAGAAAGALMHAVKKADKGARKAFLGDRKRRYWENEEEDGTLGGSMITNGLIGAGAAALAGGAGQPSAAQSTPKTESAETGETQMSRYVAEKAYRKVASAGFKRPPFA